ncbi:MAG: T9SS type A sorting domain-containing protein [Chitinophagaceae bacterium]|nr:T9SS type A sorting domain-containing protein [Chitinophagaceae bacterium]
MKRILLPAFVAIVYFDAASQQLSLIKDINPGSAGSNVCFLTRINSTVFFAANDGINGMELWKSDGTEAGTVMVKDINSGSSSSSIGYLTNVNGTLFFVAGNGVNGVELWKSDGTTAGTVMVKDIRTGSMSSNPSALANVNGTLFFAANDGVNGTELWKSDGTAGGTVIVKDINPASASAYPRCIAAINDKLFFAADNGVNGSELWVSDGSAAGTFIVKDMWPGSAGSYPSNLITTNGILFFSASDGSNGTELWKSDGTPLGTVMLKDIWPGSGESMPSGFRNVNGTLFFSADNGTNGTELWKTDGTAPGTVMVKDVWPGSESGAVGNFSKLMSQFIFTGNDGTSGYKTWQSDGSAAGTTLATLVADSISGSIQELVETNDRIFASIIQPEEGKELWGTSFGGVLPIQLLEFKARLLADDAIINWKIDQEANTPAFVLERSYDGGDFAVIANIDPVNSTGRHDYIFPDRNIMLQGKRIVYYRLRLTDTYGKITTSPTVSISLSKNNGEIVIYPNPVVNDLNLSIYLTSKDKIVYRVADTGGRIADKGEKQMSPGNGNILINTRKLSAGVYYIDIQGSAFKKQLSFVKQ